MKVKRSILILSTLFLVVGCAKPPLPEELERFENFAFVISYSLCGPYNDYYDSGNKTLTHRPIGDTKEYTTTLEMTDLELDTIFQKMLDTGYFNLPKELVPPDNPEQYPVLPDGEYGIAVVNGSIHKTVHYWDEEFDTLLFEDAKKFLELAHFIHRILISHEEYQALPQSKEVCID